MRPLKVFSILTITLLAISTSSCKKTDNETSMLSSLEEQSAKEPLKLTDAEKKIIAENENTLRVTKECVKCDFRGAEFRAANLGGADLSNAKLSYADLRSANLNDVIISCADLRRADLSNARLNYSDFQEADLSNARLSYADLRGVNLWWTKLPEKLSNAVFEGAKTGPENTWLLRGKL